MKRGRKPKVDVTALEHIPAVRAALEAVGLELVIRPFTEAKTAVLECHAETFQRPSAPEAHVLLDTPERQEYAQQQQDVLEAVRAEKARLQPVPVSKMPAGQRRAVEQGFMLDVQSRRAEKLSQFKHDGVGETETVVGSEELTTLAEAT